MLSTMGRAAVLMASEPHGVSQVSYDRHPLYYWKGGHGYAGDSTPGDVNGQKFFNVWYVVSPKGNAIK
jgi:predicted lipoprotein with Yx(FWY)xxD motif